MSGDSDAERVWRELDAAERFRKEGDEGRARVCARRAAVGRIRPTFQQMTGQAAPKDAVALLRWYREWTGAPTELRSAAGRLAVAVTTEHDLPHAEDPLADAGALVRSLIPRG